MTDITIRPFRPQDDLSCRQIAAEHRWVAEQGGQVIGLIELNGHHIENLFVAPADQGKGLGARLIAAVEQATEGDLTLSVFHQNPRARALYERLGFRVVMDRDIDFHGQPATVWFMRKARAAAPRFDAMIFDFDGVLADSRDWMVQTLIRLSAEFGLQPLTKAAVEELRHLSNRDILKRMKVPVWKLPAMMRRGRDLAEQAGDDIQPFAGTYEMLHALKARGLKLAIVTSNSQPRITRTLGDKTMALFDVVDCGAALFGKASRLKRVAKALSVPLARAAYVGDETRDIEAAQKARITAIAATWGYAQPDTLKAANPDHLVSSFEELIGVV